ncbi:MAG: hypothetical protein ABSH28_11425, partial [Acidobacteriota bacterium]
MGLCLAAQRKFTNAEPAPPEGIRAPPRETWRRARGRQAAAVSSLFMKPGESLIERHRIESKLGPAAQNDLRAANSPGLQRAP